ECVGQSSRRTPDAGLGARLVQIPTTGSTWEGCRSGAVISVDADIAVREIAGPDGGSTLPDADIDRDLQLGALHVGGPVFLGIAGSDPALFGDEDVAETDGQPVPV